MNTQDFTTTFLVDQTPRQAFDAINNVRGWWKEEIEGDCAELNDEFAVHFGDVHYSKQKLTEVAPDAKVVWQVTDSRLNFVKDDTEWSGTQMVFDISKQGDQTQVSFTHTGLVPEVECFGDCSGAWTYYIQESLKPLITTGKGQPTP